jgi:hypothetical protein
VPLLAGGISLKPLNKLDGNLFGIHNSFIKTIKALRLVLPCYWGMFFLINMLGTHEGHNDRLLQLACRFSVLAAMFVLGKERGELARVAQEVQGHVIRRALVKIPSDLVCIIESIRGMSVDISRRKTSRR